MYSKATIIWEKKVFEPFTDDKYTRVHTWSFDGGQDIKVSASPQEIPEPMSEAKAVDPGEAFLAALSSCHMLEFLSVAAKSNWLIEYYEDNAIALLEKDETGQLVIEKIILSPRIIFGGTEVPGKEELQLLHDLAHDNCYLTRSIKATVEIEVTDVYMPSCYPHFRD